VTPLLFLIALVVIVAGAELFTNAVEWAGYRMRLGSGATGSLLAAFGTSLPEAIVPVVALIRGAPDADRIATGAVLGSSFLLLTLGSSVTGLAVLARRGASELTIEAAQVRRDLGFFVVGFAITIGASALPAGVRPWVGALLLGIYAVYVLATLRGGNPAEEMPEPLHFVRWRRGRRVPPLPVVISQLAVAVVLLIVGSNLFVDALHRAADSLNLNPLVLAVVLVPFATEMPETFNSVLWVRSRDDGLAFGNIAGSATFQACILGFIGVTFTTWSLGTSGLLSAAAAFITGVYLLMVLRHGHCRGGWLAAAAIPWIAYVMLELTTGARLG
jgi:cation:H+ antiporter